MNEQVNDLEFEDVGVISEFKINTMIFCTQKSMNQNMTKIDCQPQNSPYINTLQNQSSLESQLVSQRRENRQEKSSKEISLDQENKQVEAKVEIPSKEVISFGMISENNKLPQGLDDYNISNLSSIENIQASPRDEQTVQLRIELNRIQKQKNSLKLVPIMIKSSSMEMPLDKYHNIPFTDLQNNTFDNGYEIKDLSCLNSQAQSCCQSPEGKKDFFQQENSLDVIDNNQNFALASAKKSKFHFEYINKDSPTIEKTQQTQAELFFAHQEETKQPKQVEGQSTVLDNSNKINENNNINNIKKNIFEIKNQKPYLLQSLPTQQCQVTDAVLKIQRMAKNNSPRKINSICQLERDLKSFQKLSFSKIPNKNTKDSQLKKPENCSILPQINNKVNLEGEDGSPKNKYKEAFEEIRRKERMSFLCERGSPEDLQEIKQLIESYPKKYLKDPKDPDHFINAKNMKGLTPIYNACKNGNLEVIKTLIRAQCSTLITSHIQKHLEETPLEVALRWNHVEICNYLLDKCNFEDKYLIKCLPLCPNAQLKKLVESKIKKKSSACTIF